MKNRSLSQADFHAKNFHMQENEKEQQALDISGRRCFQLYTHYNPNGLLRRMLRVLLVGNGGWHSKQRALTWKSRVTPYGRLLFQLAPRVRPTGETGFGLLPTARVGGNGRASRKEVEAGNPKRGLEVEVEMLPTITAQDYKKRWPNSKQQGVGEKMFMLKTPTASEGVGGAKMEDKYWNAKAPKLKMRDQVGRIGHETGKKLRLQPAMTEWMMNFPPGWVRFD